MITDPVVVIAATPRAWAAGLRARAADHGGVVVRASVLTPTDALAEQCDVVVLDDITSFLTASFVRELHQRGRAVLGMYDPGDAHGKSHLVDAGVDGLLATDVDVDELLARIQALAVASPEDRAPRLLPPEPVPPRAGRVLGVAGPVGGAGVTELALEVAAQIATAGRPAVLVDADELSPSLAQRLALPVHPNLHTAVRAVRRSEALDGCLHPLGSRHALAVLPGMATPDDWHTIRPEDASHLLGRLRGTGHTVVVDLGHCLPRAEGAAGMRFGHARALTAHCTDLLVAASPTPSVLARTIDLIGDLHGVRRRIELVLNRTGTDRFVIDEAVGELRRATGATRIHLVAEDPRVPRAAWQGARVGRGRFRRQVRQLVRDAGWVR